jgi:hypothetical protein
VWFSKNVVYGWAQLTYWIFYGCKQVSEGDLVTMVSSTFGDDMWSTRGVGLTRVLAAIRVRSGPVKLVFESPGSSKKKQVATAQKLRAKEEAAEAAQRKKDALLGELEKDEQVSLPLIVHAGIIDVIPRVSHPCNLSGHSRN